MQGVRFDGLAPAPRLELKLDRAQAQSMGLAIDDVYNAIQLMFAPVYVNDFYYQGRVLRVQMQADAKFRMNEDALSRFYLPASGAASNGFVLQGETTSDGMVPLASVMSSKWVVAPPTIQRFNGFAAMNIVGAPAPGYSSGQAMAEMQRIVSQDLPPGFGVDWAGQSLQEIRAGAEAPLLFGLSIFVVFLCLAALYESWATPIAVLLIVPVGIIGAIVAAWATSQSNDVFFKIGLITIIGLAAKNAILIVEFAVLAQQRGIAAVRGGHGSRAPAPAPHPDDVVCLHPGRVAAGVLQWCRRQCTARHRYGRGRRHVVSRHPGCDAGARVLRLRPPPGRR